jgi:diaminohydroxyphosphoribosylaminopyrimidine deaminase/5-amino-6-(5-phosphoribosylamino)uracil reductase
MEVDYLQLALDEAWKYQFLTYPNPAVGATLVVNNKIFVSAHKKAGEPHAEVNVIWEAYRSFFKTPKIKDSKEIHKYLYKNHNNFFTDAVLYVTLEPCNHYGKTPPCSLLIKNLKFKKVIIGTRDPIKSHTGGIDMLKNEMEVKVLDDKRCKELIEPFVKWQNRFLFFKFAFSLNGVYKGGYITKKSTLEWVHRLRDKVELIVIGGETVRVDRPRLDSRFVNGKAPDVLIYSNHCDFDRSIPLFEVKNRKVYIENNLDVLNRYKFVMFEGGEKLYNHFKKIIDWKLFMLNPEKIINIDNFKFSEEYSVLKTINYHNDIFLFGR